MARQVIVADESDDFVVGAAPIKEANPMLTAIAKKKAEGKTEQKEPAAEPAAEPEPKAPAEPKKKAAADKGKSVKAVPDKDKDEPATPETAASGEAEKSEEDNLREIVATTLYAINCSISGEDMIDLITCSKFAYGSFHGGTSRMIHDYIEKTKATIKNYDVFRANEAERFYANRIRKMQEKQKKSGKDN